MTTKTRSPSESDQALAKAVRARRISLGLTQEHLAHACGVSFQQLQKYESGANRISFSRLVQIARALGTSLADLTAVLEDAEAAAPSATSDYALFRNLPDADKLLRRYAALSPTVRGLLLDFLESVPNASPATVARSPARPKRGRPPRA